MTISIHIEGVRMGRVSKLYFYISFIVISAILLFIGSAIAIEAKVMRLYSTHIELGNLYTKIHVIY